MPQQMLWVLALVTLIGSMFVPQPSMADLIPTGYKYISTEAWISWGRDVPRSDVETYDLYIWRAYHHGFAADLHRLSQLTKPIDESRDGTRLIAVPMAHRTKFGSLTGHPSDHPLGGLQVESSVPHSGRAELRDTQEPLFGTPGHNTTTVRGMPWLAMSPWFYSKDLLPKSSSVAKTVRHYEIRAIQGSVIDLQLVRETHFDATGKVLKDAAVPSPLLYRTVLGSLAFSSAFGLLVLRRRRLARARNRRA